MQATSQLWKNLVAADSFNVEVKAIINGVEYTEISAPLITRSLMQDGLSVGNVVSSNCQITIRTEDVIPKSAEVQIKMRLVSYPDSEMYDEGEAPEPEITEWLPAGTYYISRRTKDPVNGVITLDCYDALLRANAAYEYGVPLTNEDGEYVTDENENIIMLAPPKAVWTGGQVFPDGTEIDDVVGGIPMQDMVANIARILDVSIDPRTTIHTNRFEYYINPDDNFQSIRDALSYIAQVHGGNWIITPENKLRLVPLVSSSGAEEATSDVVDTIAVLTSITTNDSELITGIRNTYDEVETLIGDDSGFVINSTLPLFKARLMSQSVIGLDYKPYTLGGTIYDPAAELGDYLRNKQSVRGVIYSEVVSLGMSFRGDISAPDPAEIADEYPYVGAAAKNLSEAKQYADEVAEKLDESLDQQSVFNRLTNGGAAQGMYIDNETGDVYFNGRYMQIGKITDQTGANSWDLDTGELITKKGKIGEFDLDEGNLTYGEVRNGGAGAYIGKDGVEYARAYNNEAIAKTKVNGQGIGFYWNGQLRTSIFMLTDGLVINTIGYDGNPTGAIQIWNNSDGYKAMAFGMRVSANGGLEANGADIRNGLNVAGGVNASGGLSVSGGITINPDTAGEAHGVGIGTFTTADGKTVTVNDGIIVSIT